MSCSTSESATALREYRSRAKSRVREPSSLSLCVAMREIAKKARSKLC